MHLLAGGKNILQCQVATHSHYLWNLLRLMIKVFKRDSSLHQISISNTFSISCLYDRKTNLYSTSVRQDLLVFGNQFSWSLSPPSPALRALFFVAKFLAIQLLPCLHLLMYGGTIHKRTLRKVSRRPRPTRPGPTIRSCIDLNPCRIWDELKLCFRPSWYFQIWNQYMIHLGFTNNLKKS